MQFPHISSLSPSSRWVWEPARRPCYARTLRFTCLQVEESTDHDRHDLAISASRASFRTQPPCLRVPRRRGDLASELPTTPVSEFAGEPASKLPVRELAFHRGWPLPPASPSPAPVPRTGIPPRCQVMSLADAGALESRFARLLNCIWWEELDGRLTSGGDQTAMSHVTADPTKVFNW